MSQKLWAIVPAAGVGKRVGGPTPKQYLALHNKAIIEWTLERLLQIEEIESVVTVISEGDEYWPELSIANNSRIRTTAGGDERCYSVLNGLSALASDAAQDDWVMVHDAARPCVRIDDIHKLITQTADKGIGGILAIPVRDTMKRASNDQTIAETLDRSAMWHALTPQLFRYAELKAAIDKALDDGFEVTDEASAMEHAGVRPLLVEGHSDNIKVTLPQDLQLAAYFLNQQTD